MNYTENRSSKEECFLPCPLLTLLLLFFGACGTFGIVGRHKEDEIHSWIIIKYLLITCYLLALWSRLWMCPVGMGGCVVVK